MKNDHNQAIGWSPIAVSLDENQLNIDTVLVLGLRPANGRRGYKVTPSLTGWRLTWNQSCRW